MNLIDVLVKSSGKECVFHFVNTTNAAALDSIEKATKKVNWETIGNFTFNFTHVTFVGSPIIGAILNIVNKAKKYGFNVHFQGMNQELIDLLKTAGIYRILQLSIA